MHSHDLSAVCLAHGYTHLRLPAEAESRTAIAFPHSGRTVVREPGEVLWPAREGPEQLAQQQLALGSYAYAGQYQQRPSPRGGGLFKREWWMFYDDLPDGLHEYAQSWDLAFKGGGEHDFVVGLVAARRGADIFLIDRYKAHASFQETLTAIRRLSQRYPRTRRIFIEDAANGPAIIDTLRREIPGVIAVKPQGGKYARASACEPRVEAGNVYLPRPVTAEGRRLPGRAWVADFIEQLAMFRTGEHDDDVDAFTQLLVRWTGRSMPPGMLRRMFQAGRKADAGPPQF